MNEDVEFTWPAARDFADQIVFATSTKHLSDLETRVLQGAWENKTYEEMATLYHYGAAYLNRDVGNPLWKKLSRALGEKVSKTNFRQALRRAWETRNAKETIEHATRQPTLPATIPSLTAAVTAAVTATVTATGAQSPQGSLEVPFVEGPVAPDSPFYIEREGVETLGFKAAIAPGSLLRIKAPSLMGKTSLLYKVMDHAASQNCATVAIDFGSLDRSMLVDLDKLLRWFCATLSRRLALPNRLQDLWDAEIFGSNDNCTAYFEEYLLPALDRPLVLGLDNVDRIFPYQAIIEDLFGMLRSWHEKGRISPIWQRLRLILVHSTEVYIPLDYNQSPFNTGIPIELPEFTRGQIGAIATLHRLSLNNDDIDALMATIGGHPYLVRLALYELSHRTLTLTQLLQQAPTETGIYSNHLRHHWIALQPDPDLLQCLKTVVTASEPVSLPPLKAYKLHSMGLVQRQDNRVAPRCSLYQDYFSRMFLEKF